MVFGYVLSNVTGSKTIHLLLSGLEIIRSPFSLQILPAETSIEYSSCNTLLSIGTAGSSSFMMYSIRDAFGNIRELDLFSPSIDLRFSLKLAGNEIPHRVLFRADSSIEFTTTVAGRFQTHLSIGSQLLKNSPSIIVIQPSQGSAVGSVRVSNFTTVMTAGVAIVIDYLIKYMFGNLRQPTPFGDLTMVFFKCHNFELYHNNTRCLICCIWNNC